MIWNISCPVHGILLLCLLPQFFFSIIFLSLSYFVTGLTVTVFVVMWTKISFVRISDDKIHISFSILFSLMHFCTEFSINFSALDFSFENFFFEIIMLVMHDSKKSAQHTEMQWTFSSYFLHGRSFQICFQSCGSRSMQMKNVKIFNWISSVTVTPNGRNDHSQLANN